MAESSQFDLMILGAGPAGMTAGVYAARKQVKTVIISKDVGGQANWSSNVGNYPGYSSISGADLIGKFQEQLLEFDVTMVYGTVQTFEIPDGGFRATLSDGQSFVSRAAIMATGKSSRMLGVPGERQFVGKGVTYCATCDGPLFSGQTVAVVGGGNSGLDAAVQMMKICPKVYLVESTDSLRADEVMIDQVYGNAGVEILLSAAVKEIRGDQFVKSMVVEDRKTGESRELAVEGIIVEVGLQPNTTFGSQVLPLNAIGEVVINCGGETAVPGLFAAGDVTSVPHKQIIIAAGDGAKAALGAYSYLVRLPVDPDWGS